MNKNEPYVTIFILIYNNADGLAKTVESVLSQTYGNAEVILSDDGSSNYDTGVLEEYAEKLREKYKNVRININEKNMGTVKHLNRVNKMAEGKYLYNCCSGDTFAGADTVQKLTQAFEKKNCLILAARRNDIYPEGRRKKRPSVLALAALKFCPEALLEHMVRKKNLISGCCTFCAKELFETCGYYDEDYFLVEDYPYYVQLLLKKHSFGVTMLTAVDHGIGGVSTGKVHPAIYKDIEMMREKLYPIRNRFSKKTAAFLEECHASYQGHGGK